MTQKVYKTARGKQIDIGSMRLQNENVRAVGNMGVNARGDRIDANNNVIDSRNQQLQRRINRQTNVSDGPVHTSTQDPSMKPLLTPDELALDNEFNDDAPDTQLVAPLEVAPAEVAPAEVAPVEVAPVVQVAPEPVAETTSDSTETSGLAAAIARAKTVKQELEKTARQKQQSSGTRKI